MSRRRGVVLPFVKKRRRLGDGDVVVKVEVTQGRHPVPVRCLVLHHHHERLALVALILEPVYREVGDHVSAVAVDAVATICEDHVRIVVESLTRQHGPVIEPLRFSLEMALAVERGLVAVFAKDFWEDLLIPVERVAVVHEPVLVAVLAAEDHRAAWPADGVGTKTLLKEHSLPSQLVDDRGGVDRLQPAVVCADGMGCVVVREDKQNVGSL